MNYLIILAYINNLCKEKIKINCKTYNKYDIILYVHGDVFGFDSNVEI